MMNEKINFEHYANDAPTFLGKHEYGRLREAIHTSQLSLFQEVFLRSLKVLNETLREIQVEGQHGMSLFDFKVNELCSAFKRLNGMADLYSKESEVFRNLAVTAFVFYRVLYKGIFDAFVNHHKTQAHFSVDTNVLYKRIPHKLYDFLGGQYWRIYEFHQVVEGGLDKLILNEDIKTFIFEATQDKTILGVSSVEIKEEKSVLINEQEESKEPNQVIEQDSIKNLNLIDGFKSWLQKQLDQNILRINENGIYSSKLKYGSALFIETKLLTDYCSLYQKKLSELQEQLRQQNSKVYKMKLNQKTLEVYKLEGIEVIFDEFNPQEIDEES